MMNWSPGTAGHNGPVVVNTPSKAALLAELAERLATGQGFTVATLNLDHVVKLRRDPAFRAAYARHSHVVADGNPIVWLARLAGQRTELAPGSELVEPVAGLAAEAGVPVALVGSTEAALEAARAALARRHPGLDVVARIAPPMGFDPEGPAADDTIGRIAASGAGLCFLALGAPRQEIFAVRAHERLPGVGFLSIGAGLDFLAGSQVRAPAFVRALAAEWLWRLGTNPRRLAGRYGACLAVLPSLAGTALATRRRT
jgi:N-acetylglucosaminyldiphosphoundecaprenol N-acetyl-beta-D-mannosaminyltransferase